MCNSWRSSARAQFCVLLRGCVWQGVASSLMMLYFSLTVAGPNHWSRGLPEHFWLHRPSFCNRPTEEASLHGYRWVATNASNFRYIRIRVLQVRVRNEIQCAASWFLLWSSTTWNRSEFCNLIFRLWQGPCYHIDQISQTTLNRLCKKLQGCSIKYSTLLCWDIKCLFTKYTRWSGTAR
jgi:hypothetical protein